MNNAELRPHEQAELDRQRSERANGQPYATEVDNRELEHAHAEKRPARPQAAAQAPADKQRQGDV